jgi:hypothetical protein
VLAVHRDEIGTPIFPLFWDGYPIAWIPQLLVGFPHTGFWQSQRVLLVIWAVFITGAVWLAWRVARARSAGNISALGVFLCGLFAVVGPYVAMRITTPPPGAYDWVRFTAFAAPALLLSLAGLAALLRPILRVLAVCAWLVMAGFQWQSEIASPPTQDWRGVLSTVSAGAKEGDAFLAFTAFHAGAAASYYSVPLQVEGGWFTGDGNDPTGAAYWFPPDWQWRGFLNPVTRRSTDWQAEITARTTGATRLWYLAGDGADGTYPPGPAFERALSTLGWHLQQEWRFSPLLLKLYTRQ